MRNLNYFASVDLIFSTVQFTKRRQTLSRYIHTLFPLKETIIIARRNIAYVRERTHFPLTTRTSHATFHQSSNVGLRNYVCVRDNTTVCGSFEDNQDKFKTLNYKSNLTKLALACIITHNITDGQVSI